MRISVSRNAILFTSLASGMFLVIALLVFFWSVVGGRALSEIPTLALLYALIFFLLVAIVVLLVAVMKRTYAVEKLKQNQYSLEESKSRFLWLYRNSPVPYVTIDTVGKITLTNLAALRLFKLSESDLISRKLTEFINDDSGDNLPTLFGKLQTFVAVNQEEVQITVSDGSHRWVMLSVFIYGNTTDRLVTLVDITKQREIDQAKSEFVSFASHQLRTPISAIRWNLELLGSDRIGQLNEKQLQYFEKINRNTHKMVTLIDDFLNVSKLEMGTFATEVVEINLASFFEDILEEFQERIETKNITISTSFFDTDYTIHADTRLLHIIISNLVSNAVKYTADQGIVEIGYANLDGKTIITVKDNGLGIPAEEIDKLFTKFFRASNARASVTDGTGLGLHIVKQSVALMGGTIDVQSTEGVGTMFTVSLPI